MGDREELKRVQKLLKVQIKEGKECYTLKMEQKLQQKNVREVWSDLNRMSVMEIEYRDILLLVDRRGWMKGIYFLIDLIEDLVI